MHELGHALGISHSNVKNAIMHGQYQRDVLELRADDVNAIRKLYGGNFGGLFGTGYFKAQIDQQNQKLGYSFCMN